MEEIVYYLLIFLTEGTILWQYSLTLFPAKHSCKIQFAALCGLYSVLFILSLFGSKWVNIAFYFVCNFLFFATQCLSNACSALFHSSILTSVMMICEGMVYYMIRYFSPHYFAEKGNIHNLILFAILSKLIFFTVIYILLHVLRGRQNCGDQQESSPFLLTWIPITSVFVMLTFIKISDSCSLSSALNRMMTLSAALLLLINLLVFGIYQYDRKKNMEFTEMQLLLQKESDSARYYEMLLSQHENQSILIHDIKKHLQSIHMLNANREPEKIRRYIHELMQSSDLREVSRLCDHEMLNAILAGYGRQCLDRHISFHADIRSGTLDFIADTDITSLFCNLLDNALAAAGHSPEPFIELNVCRREKTPFIVISVVNSSRKNPLEEPDGKLPTTKPDKRRHGFGIKSIRKTVSKYHGDMQMYYHQETLTFHTVITLKQ